MSKSKVSMKLLIDTKSKRVAFAEAGKECVDFLFQILSLPVATIIGLLTAQGMNGSLPNLYKSLENLNHTYILPEKNKKAHLNPVPSCSVPLLAIEDVSTKNTSYCSDCGQQMVPEDGLVKGMVTYIVMDDLKVKPMFTICTVTLLNQFNVKMYDFCFQKCVHVKDV